jgi:hypothetical protein
MNYSEEALIFLVETFGPKAYDRTLRGIVLEAYYQAEMYLLNRTEKQYRSCTCQYRNLANYVNNLWLQERDTIHIQYDAMKTAKNNVDITVEVPKSKAGRKKKDN